jgi:DNA mismatch endonuclease, patch repair protein
MGLRYRLHDRDLPGCPDLVFPRHHKIIFVHGCFWHLHSCQFGRVRPKTNARYWHDKRKGNSTRDRKNITALRRVGWKVLIVWECWIRQPALLQSRLRAFLADC